jgi:3-methylfumaryl-CoA hydratase
LASSDTASKDDQAVIATDTIDLATVAAMSATLDLDAAPAPGDPLPLLWHWLYFWPVARQSALGEDGHAAKGGFLPDLGLPRRMWAGGRLRFVQPVRVGQLATRASRVVAIEQKEGRSGRLAFVTVKHEIRDGNELQIEEEHDIVYRDAPTAGAPAPATMAAPENAMWQRSIVPDEVLLFRYSALTFNGHRIHYDRDYVTSVEGYPDLVVHGPLIATLLIDLLRRSLPDATVLDYSYRAVRPTFLGNPFYVCGKLAEDGKTVELWSKDHEGWLTMSARATLA